MKTAFHGLGSKVYTFETAAAAADCGKVCKIASGAAAVCGADEGFCGVITDVRGGAAAVQLRGYAEVTYSGSAPACGWCALCADGSGGVKTGEGAHEFLVVSVDETASTLGLWL